MAYILKMSFVWQFAGGFALGALALVALHPGAAMADTTPTHLVAAAR